MRRRCRLGGQTHLYQVKTLFNIYCCVAVVVYRWLRIAAYFRVLLFYTFIICAVVVALALSHTHQIWRLLFPNWFSSHFSFLLNSLYSFASRIANTLAFTHSHTRTHACLCLSHQYDDATTTTTAASGVIILPWAFFLSIRLFSQLSGGRPQMLQIASMFYILFYFVVVVFKNNA